MAWVRKGATITCQDCGKVATKKSGTHTYCSNCSAKRERAYYRARAKKKRTTAIGRICSECFISDDEASWSDMTGKISYCGTCRRRFHRAKYSGLICRKCQHLTGPLGCVRCTKATPGRVDVTILDKSPRILESRVVRRHLKDGKFVLIAGKRRRFANGDIWVDHKTFITTRH